MKRIKTLILTNLFPNPEQPLRGNFIASLVKEICKITDITIVSPLPWHRFHKIPFVNNWDGLTVYYPKYPFVPVLSRPLQPVLMTLSIFKLVERLVIEKGINLINAHWVYPDGISAVWTGRRIGVPVIVSARGCDINLYGNYRLRKPQIRWALEHSHRVITVSNNLSEIIVNNMALDKRKVIVIRNGVDKDRFSLGNREDYRKRTGLYLETKYLIFIGQMHEVKGVNYLIDALYILKKKGALTFKTILIGDGPLKKNVEDWIRKRDLTKDILLLGEKPNDEIPLWMNACNLFCLPSKREGLPNVILEATATGLPVVASRVGGISEIVDDSNGILVEPGNPSALADAIVTAFKKKWDRERIREKVNSFSWEKSAEMYFKIYQEVLAEI